MAELQRVIQEAARMCGEHDECGNCPLREMVDMAAIYCPIPIMRQLDTAKVEAAVMDWAAAHSEPRYPSWNEVWQQWFPEAKEGKPPCVRYMLGKEQYEELCDMFEYCEECRRQPIPAYIAERLGIKPIGGEENEKA